MITAEEVEGLDLHGCDLAVLSACDTGRGKVAGGQGAMGLQRAFHQAGARTAVTSLWRIDDDDTKRLMAMFYNNLWQMHLPAVRRYDRRSSRYCAGQWVTGPCRVTGPDGC